MRKPIMAVINRKTGCLVGFVSDNGLMSFTLNPMLAKRYDFIGTIDEADKLMAIDKAHYYQPWTID